MIRSLIKKDFVMDKLDGEINIFDSQRSILYSFNRSGSIILEMLKKGFNQDKMVKALSKKYRISVKQATNDVSDFLKYLSMKKIIFPLKQNRTNRQLQD